MHPYAVRVVVEPQISRTPDPPLPTYNTLRIVGCFLLGMPFAVLALAICWVPVFGWILSPPLLLAGGWPLHRHMKKRFDQVAEARQMPTRRLCR